MLKSLLALQIEDFSSCFREMAKIWLFYSGLKNFDEIRDNPHNAIKFFANMAHERAGKNPKFPRNHRAAIERALKDEKFEDAIHDKGFPNRVWKEFEILCTDKKGEVKSNKKNTEGPVKIILEKMREENEPNILELLNTKKLKDARDFLRKEVGRGIGDKVSAFIMRDFYDFFGLWEKELREKENRIENYSHLQPVDRWVRRISEIIWNEIKLNDNHDKVAKEIVRKCFDEEVNPVSFNQGAWFVGAKICDFYGIPYDKINKTTISELVRINDVKKTRKSIMRLHKGLI